MFLGIAVNTFCFVHVFSFIRKRRESCEVNKEFIDFNSRMDEIMYRHYANLFKVKDFKWFKANFDVKSFLLNRQEMENLQYIRTGYFYYLEFQINAIIVIIFLLISFGLNFMYRDVSIGNHQYMEPLTKVLAYFFTCIVGLALCILFWTAAKKNESNYVKKELSYLLGAFHICKSHKQ